MSEVRPTSFDDGIFDIFRSCGGIKSARGTLSLRLRPVRLGLLRQRYVRHELAAADLLAVWVFGDTDAFASGPNRIHESIERGRLGDVLGT